MATPTLPWNPIQLKWHDYTTLGPVADLLHVIEWEISPTAGDGVTVGVCDPADPSRFTIPFTYRGIHGTIEGQLCDDDSVLLRIKDANQLAQQIRAHGLDFGVIDPRDCASAMSFARELETSPEQKWGLFQPEPPMLTTDDNQ